MLSPNSRSAGDPARPTPLTTALTSEQRQRLGQIASRVMADPLLKRQLAERVYELMQADLRLQHERTRSYGGLG